MRLEKHGPDWRRLEVATNLNTDQLERIRIVRGSENCNRRSRFWLFDDGTAEDKPNTEAEENRMDIGKRSELRMLNNMIRRGYEINPLWSEEEGQFMIHSDVFTAGTEDLYMMLGHPDGYIYDHVHTKEWMLLELKTVTKADLNSMRPDFDPEAKPRYPNTVAKRYLQQMRRYVALSVKSGGERYLRIPQGISQTHAMLVIMCRDTGEMLPGVFRVFGDKPRAWEDYLNEQMQSILQNERPWKPDNYFADADWCQRCAFFDNCYSQNEVQLEDDVFIETRNRQMAELYIEGHELENRGKAMKDLAKDRAEAVLNEMGETKMQLTPDMTVGMRSRKGNTSFDQVAMEDDGVLDKYKIESMMSSSWAQFYPKRKRAKK